MRRQTKWPLLTLLHLFLSSLFHVSQTDFTKGSEFFHANLYWPKKMKNATMRQKCWRSKKNVDNHFGGINNLYTHILGCKSMRYGKARSPFSICDIISILFVFDSILSQTCLKLRNSCFKTFSPNTLINLFSTSLQRFNFKLWHPYDAMHYILSS